MTIYRNKTEIEEKQTKGQTSSKCAEPTERRGLIFKAREPEQKLSGLKNYTAHRGSTFL